ncbi:MAG: hypothetical protein V4519_03895 [Patescibacteria group bacterium]
MKKLLIGAGIIGAFVVMAGMSDTSAVQSPQPAAVVMPFQNQAAEKTPEVKKEPAIPPEVKPVAQSVAKPESTPVPTPTPAPTPKPVPPPEPKSEPVCNTNYSGCLKIGAGDYDCRSGSGNGPNYTGKVQVLGYDEFDLDRDNDGWGCE